MNKLIKIFFASFFITGFMVLAVLSVHSWSNRKCKNDKLDTMATWTNYATETVTNALRIASNSTVKITSDYSVSNGNVLIHGLNPAVDIMPRDEEFLRLGVAYGMKEAVTRYRNGEPVIVTDEIARNVVQGIRADFYAAGKTSITNR